MTRFLSKLFLAFAVLFTSFAIWRIPETKKVPISRVIENLEKKLAQNTNDQSVVAALARVHSMAYATKAAELSVISTNEMPAPAFGPELPPDHSLRLWESKLASHHQSDYEKEIVARIRRELKSEAERAEAKRHLTNAIEYYSRAIVLVNTNPTTQLGLAWCLEENGQKDWAKDWYRRALALAWPNDIRERVRLHDPLTAEIAIYLQPLLDPVKDKNELAKIEAYKKMLSEQTRAYTPIIIPLHDNLSLEDCFNPASSVGFDFEGLGQIRRGWITTNAAWLVYDSDGTGEITSGLQLFGSVTFWLFWKNGYEALSALDDNQDLLLKGRELENISLWHDINSNGVSERGEVTPVTEMGIERLEISYETRPDGIPWNCAGVLWRGEISRPTYDVILPEADD